MARDEGQIKYIATGAHEHGHALNAERSRYPRLRSLAVSLGPTAGTGLGIVGGLAARTKGGALAGTAVGVGVSGLGSLPQLIEEYQASKNGLKAMRDSGKYSEEEYTQAKRYLDGAYKTYISSALSRAALAGGVGSGRPDVAVTLLGGALVENARRARKAREELSGARGGSRDVREVRDLSRRMGTNATTQFAKQKRGDLPSAYYAAPHAHIENVVKEKEYARLLNKGAHGKHDVQSTLTRGGVYLPPPEKR
jgi:Putative neutral zinc metallopeptidase